MHLILLFLTNDFSFFCLDLQFKTRNKNIFFQKMNSSTSAVELARNMDINTTSHSILFSSTKMMKTSFVNISANKYNYSNENTLSLKRNFSQIKHVPNMCSSMISQRKHRINLKESMNGKANNLKRIKQAIANKLKKFQLRRNLKTVEPLPSSDNAKLVKFNYKSYFVLPDRVESTNQVASSSLSSSLVQSNKCCSCFSAEAVTFVSAKNKFNSDGEQSFTSSSSSSASTSSLHSFNEQDINSDLFLAISNNNNNNNNSNEIVSCMFKTMPLYETSATNTLRITSTPNKKSNKSMYLDQSTQIQIDSPVLIESTFNTSSCSDLSDDLIILQAPVRTVTPNTYIAATPKVAADDLLLNAERIPDWACGPQLNLAVVNQHYFNHEAASEIFC